MRRFCEKLTGAEFGGSGAQSKAGAALRVLSNLFHGFGVLDSAQRATQYDIYCSMLRIGGESGLINELPANPDKLKLWFDDWKLDKEKRRHCLRLLHAVRWRASFLLRSLLMELSGSCFKMATDCRR